MHFNFKNLLGRKDNAAARDPASSNNNGGGGGDAKEEDEFVESSGRSLASRALGKSQAQNSTSTTNDNDEEKPPTNEEEEEVVVENVESDENEKKKEVHLSKHPQLQGYIVLFASSAVNLSSSLQSNLSSPELWLEGVGMRIIPASEKAKDFALANAGIVGGFAAFALIAHFDRFSCLKGIWMKLFKPNACFEKAFLALLIIWCAAATWINTSVRGLAGPGKGQFDIYFTTWISFIASIWTLERWYVLAGHSSFVTFFSSWPHRGFAWIGFFGASLGNFFFVLDVYINWEDGSKRLPSLDRLFRDVANYQWIVLIIVCLISFVVALFFSAVELFRVSRVGVASEKAKWENMTEGGTLLALVGCWLFCVIVTTSPGGLGSMYGNVYFFTWACTVIVIKTFLWWVRDWRRDIHLAAEMEHEEYEKAKQAVLAQNAVALSQRDGDY
mmetsp:Transcript_1221/g.1744  ORF Transcript_1221/g.1744 Transcript_1221/m.1744 type:complete len:443 (-) Transcript_1221:24-1352(-)